MRRFIFIIIATFFSASLLFSCSGSGDNTDGTESQEALYEAMADGRNAAKLLIGSQWKDTLELQKIFLEVKARQSKYLMEDRPQSAAAFDSAFINTLRLVRPDLAKHLQ